MSAENIKVKEATTKKKFKMPHILWLMLGLLLLATVLTYIVPAGQFARDTNGNIIASDFNLLEKQTPISIGEALMLILPGMVNQASVMLLVLAMGSNTAILLETRSIEQILNWAVYKLQDKGKVIAIIAMFILMTYIGGFAGSDALIAMVPIGIVFSKKFKLDSMVALGLTTYPAMIGFATGPSSAWIAQGMMNVSPYSGSIFRFVLMNVFMVIGLLYLFRYINRIEKDPKNSVMYSEGWHPELVDDVKEEVTSEKLNIGSLLTLLIYLGQYVFIIYYSLTDGSEIFAYTVAANILAAVGMGLVNKMSLDDLGNTFAKGINSMGFVIFVIGLAGAFSLIMSEGNIIDTIVYSMTRPLMNISRGVSSIGIALVTAILNIFIPSASSKAAIVAPIIAPIGEALEITGQVAVQAYQVGDRLTNFISPVLGWLMGSLVTAKISYTKWLRWIMPILMLFLIISLGYLFILTEMGWTGL